jgi:hypothetical protein
MANTTRSVVPVEPPLDEAGASGSTVGVGLEVGQGGIALESAHGVLVGKVGSGVGLGVAVGVGVGTGVGVGVGAGVAVGGGGESVMGGGGGVGVAVGEGVGLAVGVDVEVGLALGVAVADATGVEGVTVNDRSRGVAASGVGVLATRLGTANAAARTTAARARRSLNASPPTGRCAVDSRAQRGRPPAGSQRNALHAAAFGVRRRTGSGREAFRGG